MCVSWRMDGNRYMISHRCWMARRRREEESAAEIYINFKDVASVAWIWTLAKKKGGGVLDWELRTVELLCNCSQSRTDAEQQLCGQPEVGAEDGVVMMRNTEEGGKPLLVMKPWVTQCDTLGVYTNVRKWPECLKISCETIIISP